MSSIAANTANTIIEEQLDRHLEELEKAINGDVVAFLGPIEFGVDSLIRDAVEYRKNLPQARKKLIVILETPGGFIEVAQRIADTLRRHYSQAEFVIPNYAMSAGTVLVMCGDAIHMDYFSILGPIDPQVRRLADGPMMPALGYLIQYERLIAKSKAGKLTTAELTFLVQKFDPAELYRYEQARELSISLLKEWLVKYKFRNWKHTETRKLAVTATMRTQRAASIAKKLNDTALWHSHGRGISMEVLTRDLNLKIDDFGAHPPLNDKIRVYYKLLLDYMMRRSHPGVIHTIGHYFPV